MAEDVTAFVERVGIQTALEILGEDVWKHAKFTFEQWDSTYRIGVNENDLSTKAKVLEKMVNNAFVIENWLKIWKLLPADHPLRLLVIEKIKERLQLLSTFDKVLKWQPTELQMDFHREWEAINEVWLQRLLELAEMAKHFEYWQYVLYEAERRSDSALAVKALDKMVECADKTKSVTHWDKIYHKAPNDSPLKKNALKKMIFLVQDGDRTFPTWRDIWHKTQGVGSDLEGYALSKVLNYASNFEEWFSIFAGTKDNVKVRAFCLDKLVTLAEISKKFRHWLALFQSGEGELKDRALAQILDKAEDVDNWCDIWQWAPEGSEAKAKALKWLQGFVVRD